MSIDLQNPSRIDSIDYLLLQRFSVVSIKWLEAKQYAIMSDTLYHHIAYSSTSEEDCLNVTVSMTCPLIRQHPKVCFQ